MRGVGCLVWGLAVVAGLGLGLGVLGLKVGHDRFGCTSTVEVRVVTDPQTGRVAQCWRVTPAGRWACRLLAVPDPPVGRAP